MLLSAEQFIKDSKKDGLEQLLSTVSKGGILTITAEEPLRLSRFLTWLSKSWGPVNSYIASGVTESLFFKEILPKLSSDSLFSEKELVVIHESDKLKKGVKEHLESRSKTFSEKTILCLVYAKPQKTGIKVSALKGEKLLKWVIKEFKAQEAEIPSSDAAFFVDKVGEDLHLLSQEITKLTLISDGDKITRKNIDEACSGSEHGSSNKMLSALLEKDAVRLHKEIYNSDAHPLQSVAYMFNSLNCLLAGERNSWKVKFLSPKAKSARPEELKNTLSKLAALDIALKSGSGDAKETMATELLR